MRAVSLLAFVFSATGATVPDRFMLQMAGEPAAVHAVRLGRRAAASDAEFRAHTATLQQQHAALRAPLEAAGATVLGETTVVSNLLFVQIPAERAAVLAGIPGVLRVYPVRIFQLVLDHALPLEKVPDAWNQIGGPDKAGVGIKVGIIDSGVDPQHPTFGDSTLSPPDGFPKVSRASDKVYTSNKVIVARSYAINDDGSLAPALDTNGHGTSNAMIAAGGSVMGPFAPLSGIAPKAFVGNYKVFPDSAGGAADDWIIAALDDAVSDGMDVINLSLGSPLAPRPGDDPLVAAVENAVQVGRIVTVAAGNSGSDPNTIASPGTAVHAISVGSASSDREFAGALRVAGGPAIPAIPGSGPNASQPLSGPMADVAQFDPSGLACDTLPAGSLSGTVALILRGACLFEDKINNAGQAGAIAAIVYTDAARPDAIGMAVGAATLPAAMVSYSDGAALKQKLGAGSVQAEIDFALQSVPVSANRLSKFSSRGPSSDRGIKPDLVAIGEQVNKATIRGGFEVGDGTSFAAPMVAGAAALIEAARPGLTPSQYRSLLVNSALQVVPDSGGALTIQQSGAGLLNVLNALNNNIAVAPVSLSFGAGAGTIDQTTQLSITNIGSAGDTFSITVRPMGDGPAPLPTDNTVQLNPGQSQAIGVRFSATSLSAGAYQGYLQVQGTQNGVIATVPYWYGVPSGTATHMTVLRAPANGAPLSRQILIVRPTDDQGLPAGALPTVTVASGAGNIVSVQSSDDSYPGSYNITVRVARGTNVFHVVSGSAATDITIQSP